MKPTSAKWYLAAFFVALGSWMLATIVAAGAWDPVRAATLEPATQRVDAAGKSLAVFTDILQPDRTITCQAAGPGKKVTDIPKAALEITVDNEGDQWHLIGLLPDGADGLKVTCAPKDRRRDDASYDYATVDGFTSKANAGKGIAILGSTVGLGLAGFTYYNRRQRRIDRALEAATDDT